LQREIERDFVENFFHPTPDTSFVPPRIRHDNPLPVILKSQVVTEESGGGRNLDLSEQIIQLIFNPLWIRQAHHERIFNLSLLRMLSYSLPEQNPDLSGL
jgi:hypothetical protein